MLKNEKMAKLLGVMLITLGYGFAGDVKLNGCKGPSLCADLPLKENCGFYFNVGLIYEQMRVSNTLVAFKQHVGPEDGTSWDPTYDYTMYNYGFGMEPGFKFAMGYEPGHDDWSLKTSFEWLRSQGTFGEENTTANLLEAYFNNSDNYKNINATLDIDYFLLDVYLARGSYISNKFALEPLVGIKASWIYYDKNATFASSTSLTTRESFLIVANTNFWGVGPMVGLNSTYQMSAGWSIFSLSDLSLLLGQNKLVNYRGVVTTQTVPGESKVTTTNEVICPTVRAVLGVQYERYVMCDAQHLVLRAGFDARYYFNQYPVTYMLQSRSSPTASQTPSIIENGSFGMVGLLLDLGWSF